MTGELFAAGCVRVLNVSIEVRDRGPAFADRFEAELADFPALREVGRSPWEAVHRLVAGHRGLLERRWSAEGAPR
jgi:hypothetical protein